MEKNQELRNGDSDSDDDDNGPGRYSDSDYDDNDPSRYEDSDSVQHLPVSKEHSVQRLPEYPGFNQELPKLIHFIWLGSPLPLKYLASILTLLREVEGQGYRIILWTDDKDEVLSSTGRVIPAQTNEFPGDIITAKENQNKISGIEVKETGILDDHLKKIFKEKKDAKLFETYLDSERIGLANYAARADAYRYVALHLCGGHYFDVDWIFVPDTRYKIDEESRRPFFGIRMLCYLSGGIITKCNNDYIAAVAGHKVLKELVLSCLKNYQHLSTQPFEQKVQHFEEPRTTRKADFKSDTQLNAKRFPYSELPLEFKPKLALTLFCSGPALLMRVMNQFLSDLELNYAIPKKKYARLAMLRLHLDDSFVQSMQVQEFRELTISNINLEGVVALPVTDGTWLKLVNKKNKKKYFDDTASLPKLTSKTDEKHTFENKKVVNAHNFTKNYQTFARIQDWLKTNPNLSVYRIYAELIKAIKKKQCPSSESSPFTFRNTSIGKAGTR